MNSVYNTLEQLKEDAISGDLNKADKETLSKYSSALCHQQAHTTFGSAHYPQICEAVRNNLLRVHIESLQSHITDLDSKNTTLQVLVIILAVVATISGITQTIVTVTSNSNFDQYISSLQQQKVAKQPQDTPSDKGIPCPSNTQKLNQATKKSP